MLCPAENRENADSPPAIPRLIFETSARTGEGLRASEGPGRSHLYLPSVVGWGFPQHRLPSRDRMPAHAFTPDPYTE